MAVARNTPTASFLTKIGKMQSAECLLCRIAQEARGESTDSLADETHSHINSAGCEGMFVNHFWGRRPDWVAINEALKIRYILEFKRSTDRDILEFKRSTDKDILEFKRWTDRDEGFLEVQDAEANEQHKSIISALKAAAQEWEFEQINFVVGNH